MRFARLSVLLCQGGGTLFACFLTALLLQVILANLEETLGQAPADRPIAVRNLNPLLPQGSSNPFQEQLFGAADQYRRASHADKRFDRSTAVDLLVEPTGPLRHHR